jgi:hypothetical protein
MAATESASRVEPYIERLLQNAYVQDNLLDALTDTSSPLGAGSSSTPSNHDHRVVENVCLAASVVRP